MLIFEFDVPRHAAEGGRGSRFGDAYELANFLSGEELNAATTVAFLPKSIQGHAVLVALACDQIIMAEKATIGSAGVDETSRRRDASWPPTARSPAGGGPCRWNWPWDMLRPADDVLMVQTEASTEYVTPGRPGGTAEAPHDPVAGGR